MMKDVEVKQVIVSNMRTRGDGREGNHIRSVLQVFDLNGDLIAENDPESFTAWDLVHYANWCIENERKPTLQTVHEFLKRAQP